MLSWLSTSSLPLTANREPPGHLGADVVVNLLITSAASPVTAGFISIPAVTPGAVPGDGTFVLAIHLLALGERFCEWQQSRMLLNICIVPKLQTLEAFIYI